MNISSKVSVVKKFVTNVGLITSNGSYGDNIMAAEWTYSISADAGLILVGIGNNKATYTNIIESKEFGVNIAAADQNSIASIAGNNTAKTIDKVKALKELGAEFYNAETINTLMIKDSAMNAECKLIETIEIGGRSWFVGEILTISSKEKLPLIYHNGNYWNLGTQIFKPDEKVIIEMNNLVEKFKREERVLCN